MRYVGMQSLSNWKQTCVATSGNIDDTFDTIAMASCCLLLLAVTDGACGKQLNICLAKQQLSARKC